MDEEFADSKGEVRYVDIDLKPIAYMDDANRLGEDIEEANKRMEHLADSKVLKINVSKSNYILIGNKKERTKLKN